MIIQSADTILFRCRGKDASSQTKCDTKERTKERKCAVWKIFSSKAYGIREKMKRRNVNVV